MLAAVLILPREARAVCAEKAFSLDAVSGRVLFDKNADSRSLIASTTKIMTALIVCEQCNVLDRMRIPKEAVGIEAALGGFENLVVGAGDGVAFGLEGYGEIVHHGTANCYEVDLVTHWLLGS